MIFRLLLLVALLGLSACNGADTNSPQTDADTSDSTFALATARDDLATVNATIAESERKRAQLEAERVAAQKALDDLKAAHAKEIAAVKTALEDLAVELESKTEALQTARQEFDDLTREDPANPGALKQARDALAILNGDENTPGSIKEAVKKRNDVQAELATLMAEENTPGLIAAAKAKLEKAQADLDDLTREDPDNPGALKRARDALAILDGDEFIPGSIKAAQVKLKKARDELAILNGDADTPGLIAAAQKRLDDLIRTDKDNPGEIAKAQKLLADINAKLAALGKAAKLMADGKPQEAAKGLKDAGFTQEAIDVLKGAGFFNEAADMLKAVGRAQEALKMLTDAGLFKEAAAMLKADGKIPEGAGLDADAYALFAPEEYRFIANDNPDPSSPQVNGRPSVMRHSITVHKGASDEKTLWYTASAGHLIAYGPKDITGTKKLEAAMFYVSYTRDDLPRDKRPVTFFVNGGPGAATIYLHMAAYGPKRVKIDAPNLPMQAKDFNFPVIDNDETLLDQSDLVFVDMVGTGYSTAIQPLKDEDFFDVTRDAEIFRDFVTSYSNKNNRQSSPKYVYGESYGGARVAKASALLEQAGTSNFDADPSGKPPIILSGIILNSPLLSGDSCSRFGAVFTTLPLCTLGFPTQALVTDYFQATYSKEPDERWSKTKGFDTLTDDGLDRYVDYIRNFHANTYIPMFKKLFPLFAETVDGKKVLKEIQGILAIPDLRWSSVSLAISRLFLPKKDSKYGVFDARMIATDYDPDYFDSEVLGNALKDHLPNSVNYVPRTSPDYAVVCNRCKWDYEMSQLGGVTDLAAVLKTDPKLKILALLGYYDNAVWFYQVESQLKIAKLDTDKRVTVKRFASGHMTYYTEAARGPLKKALDEFYAPATGVAATQ
ncbi:S10 family serine carboxypeptidase-like protein [Phyllobacterium sophorae]|uniref:Peptidase S10 n=1 Tax=Phyllobacterium sophorae TaxID=1520277 RepID=A0A2P7BDT5_9HYPH|nr:hypothetical protein [Phyllobacterium sophorae]PSH64637.1 hypothetical protein CU103_12180 [Phyllobacterium sophorae]